MTSERKKLSRKELAGAKGGATYNCYFSDSGGTHIVKITADSQTQAHNTCNMHPDRKLSHSGDGQVRVWLAKGGEK